MRLASGCPLGGGVLSCEEEQGGVCNIESVACIYGGSGRGDDQEEEAEGVQGEGTQALPPF
jgi:hypothetical protein